MRNFETKENICRTLKHGTSSDGIPPVSKSLQRGGINWEPLYPEGEHEVSMKAHVEYMKTEMRKKNVLMLSC